MKKCQLCGAETDYGYDSFFWQHVDEHPVQLLIEYLGQNLEKLHSVGQVRREIYQITAPRRE